MSVASDDTVRLRLRTWGDLDRATRDGSLVGARLMAGANFANKTERERIGRLLVSLADAVNRLVEQHRHGSTDEDAVA